MKLVDEEFSSGSSDLVIDHQTGHYKRNHEPHRSEAEQKLEAIYEAEKAYILSSGMNATYMLMKSLFKLNPGIYLLTNKVYSGTRRIFHTLTYEYTQNTIIEYDPSQPDSILELINSHSNIRGFFIESASNPEGFIPDWTILTSLPKDCYVIVDNTWLTPIAFNPLKYRANVVVDSASKYLSKGKCIAGAIMFLKHDKISQSVHEDMKIMGIHVSPIHSQLISQGIDALPLTLKSCYDRALMVIDRLKQNENVLKILHPALTDHPSYNLFNKYITTGFGPGVIWFKVKKVPEIQDPNQLSTLIKKCEIPFFTSFGKEMDLLDQCTKLSENDVVDMPLRLSLGWGDNSDILQKLERLFNLLNSPG